MNRFLRRGQLQTIETQKDPSVVEDMDTLVSEVSSDEFLDMVQQEGTSKDLHRAMDMVEAEGSEDSDEEYDSPHVKETEQERFFRINNNDMMEDVSDYWLSHEEFGFEDDDLEGWNPHDEYENDTYDDF